VKEVTGNLWEQSCNALCITTNGFIKQNGKAVMGRGVAKQAADRWRTLYDKDLPASFGAKLREQGNHVFILVENFAALVAFPVKGNWWEKASPALILQSAHELVALTDAEGWQSVILPRPGCGNGGLSWEAVKPILETVLDDRFTVVEFAPA
jgi:hypothetical protein